MFNPFLPLNLDNPIRHSAVDLKLEPICSVACLPDALDDDSCSVVARGALEAGLSAWRSGFSHGVRLCLALFGSAMAWRPCGHAWLTIPFGHNGAL
jgi:hypothetical protein